MFFREKVSPKSFKPEMLMFYLIFNFPSGSDHVAPEVENVLHVAIKILYEFQDKHGRDIEQRTYFKLRIDKVL